MIVGILLLYIGTRFEFPAWYMVLCWLGIISGVFRLLGRNDGDT